MKIKLEKVELIEKDLHNNHYNKFSTQINNVFIYEVTCGWLSHQLIQNYLKDNDNNGEERIIVTYNDYLEGIFCGGIAYITYSENIEEKYTLGEKLIENENVLVRDYYII